MIKKFKREKADSEVHMVDFSLLRPSKMPKGKRAKEKWPWHLLLSRSKRSRRWSTPCLRKGPRIFAMEKTFSPKGTSSALSNGLVHSAAAAKGTLYKCLQVAPMINQFTQSRTAK